MGAGDDVVTINGLEHNDRSISVVGGGDKDAVVSYHCSISELFLERVDEIEIVDLVCDDLLVNKYSGTSVPHRLGMELTDVTVHNELTVHGTGKGDVVSLTNTVVWGSTTFDLNAGSDLLYLDRAWFVEGLSAEFDSGNDMIYCDGLVYSGRNSAVRGGTTRRRGSSGDYYFDQIIINGHHSVNLGSASQWEDSDY